MKDLRPALRALLLADASVSALVGGARVYAGLVPQGVTSPSVVQNLISEGSDYHMAGSSGLGQARVQVDCWATTPDAAVALANAVMDLLSGYRGTVGPDAVVIRGVFHDQGQDVYDDTAKMHTRRRDYLIHFAQF